MRNAGLKLILVCVLGAAMLVGFTACAVRPQDVALATEADVLRYAKRSFGNADVMEVTDGVNETVYTLKDREYGFLYSVTSAAVPVWTDSVSAYKEDKFSNFPECYKAYFLDACLTDVGIVEETYGVTTRLFEENDFMSVVGESEEAVLDAAFALWEIREKFDDRHFWSDERISVYTSDGYAGSYAGEFVTAEQETIEYFMRQAASEMNQSFDALTFLRTETVARDQLVGLERERAVEVIGMDGNESDTVTKYYFSVRDEEYFITDVLIYSDGKIAHFGNHGLK
jgi:hypothetical protein